MAENPRFMMETRRKELERRQWQKEESTPVVKEKMKFSLFPHHHRSESRSRATAAIQQPAVEQKQQVRGVSAVLPPSEGPPPSKATVSPSKPSSSSNGWFISGLQGFFGPPPTAYSTILTYAAT